MDSVETFNQYRPLLFSIAYNMLGSAMDAEDIVQEAFLRWQAVDSASVNSPKAYLSAIVTNLAINQAQSAREKRETYLGPWLPEPLVSLPGEDPDTAAGLAESLSIAFLLVLETLSPTERAAYLLRQVFEYDYAEIAALLGKSEVTCRQLVHRAKARIQASQQSEVTPPEDQQRVVGEFLQACLTGDLPALMSLLSEDCVLQSDGGGIRSAARNPVYGAEKVSRFLMGIMKKMPPNTTLQPAWVNGSAGVLIYLAGQPYNVLTLQTTNGRVQAIYNIVNPDKLKLIPKEDQS